MQTALWAIFILSGIGLIIFILSKIPVIEQRRTGRVRVLAAADDLMSYLWRKVKILAGKIWHFVLEAKDLKPPVPQIPLSMNVQKVKKVFRIRIKENENDPGFMPEVAETVEQQSKSTKTAEQFYLEAIKRDPSNKQAYEGLGRLYLQEKNYSEAAETFRFLTKLDPAKDAYWSNLGLSLYSKKDFASAAGAYDKALKINSKIPTRWINLALCFDALDESAKAIKAISQALQLDKRNVAYMMLLADLYLKVQNKVRAEEVLEEILHLEPTNKLAREKLMRLRI